jgi:hypothetical protein
MKSRKTEENLNQTFPEIPDLERESPEFYAYFTNWCHLADCDIELRQTPPPLGCHNRPADVAAEFALPANHHLWKGVKSSQVFDNFFKWLKNHGVTDAVVQRIEQSYTEQRDRIRLMAGQKIKVEDLLAKIGRTI